MIDTRAPQKDADTLGRWGAENLASVIAIDSQSDENSTTIPSSAGQRELGSFLQKFFGQLGYATETDDNGNVIVTIASNLPVDAHAPRVAMMVHMDTSEGTLAVPSLVITEKWDGSAIAYPENSRLSITAGNYPETACFVGDDLLHGPGRYPVGLDDKLGMAELMTLAQLLHDEPTLPHGELVLVFRPDEEIGRMAAVTGLAGELSDRGVRYGYTIDGILPFEINVENFNASRARVRFAGARLDLPGRGHARRVGFRLAGVTTHGATARAEGYRNATVMWTRSLARLGLIASEPGKPSRQDIWPLTFASDVRLECNAEVTFLVCGDSESAVEAAARELHDALAVEIAPHGWKGAYLEEIASEPVVTSEIVASSAVLDLGRHLARFLARPPVAPLLSEDSEAYQGYSNPYEVLAHGGELVLSYRLRAFDPGELARREEHIRAVCQAGSGETAAVEPQYVDMGPRMARYPELVDWAEKALRAMGREPVRRPIRGGTGVDPFLDRGIPVANLGTGYFAPESEKEFTSRQNIARHTLWLAHLVQIIARAA